MKKALIILALVLLLPVVCSGSSIEVQEDSVKAGNVAKLDFQGELDVTFDGKDTVVIDYDGVDGEFVDATNDSVTAATTTVTADYNRTVFVNVSTASMKFVLPTASEGLQYGFVAGTNATISVKPASSTDTIKFLTLDAGDKISGGSSFDGTIGTGDSVSVICDTTDSTTSGNWYITSMGPDAWSDGGA